MPISVSIALNTAILTDIIAGWAFSVFVSSSISPSHIILVRFCPRDSLTSSYTSLEAAKLSANAFPIPTNWLPCPGKTNKFVI